MPGTMGRVQAGGDEEERYFWWRNQDAQGTEARAHRNSMKSMVYMKGTSES